jgi:hypothetical protein
VTDSPLQSDSNDDADEEPHRGPSTGTPRWVKVFGLIALALIVLVLVMLATGGHHGPGRHLNSGDGGGHMPPAGVTQGHMPPAGGDHTP